MLLFSYHISEWTQETYDCFKEVFGEKLRERGKVLRKREIEEGRMSHKLLEGISYFRIKNKMNTEIQAIRRNRMKSNL